MKRLLPSVVVFLVACGASLEGAANRPAGGGPIPVLTRVVQPEDVAVVEETLTVLVAHARLAVRSEANGQVSTVSFQDGDVVDKGAELMRLRDAAWRADVAETRAAEKLARSERDRAQALFDRARISVAELQAAQARHELAVAALDRAVEALRRTVVHTPFAGRLSTRLVEPGDVVTTDTVITELVDADPLRAEFSLPERHASWAQLGQTVEVSVDAWPARTFAAVVTYVAPAVEADTRTLRLRAEIDNAAGELSPGMSGRARITLQAPAPHMVVPADAITTRAEGPMVWVVQEGTARTRPVTLGPRRPDDVVVLDGLAAGDEIVVSGIVRLREGAEVTTGNTP